MIVRLVLVLFCSLALWAQQPAAAPKPGTPAAAHPAPAVQAAPQPQPAKPAEAAAPATAPAEQAPAPPPAARPASAPDAGFVLNLQNASLHQVIDILAKRLRINYILDPRVKGAVNISTYGELKQVEHPRAARDGASHQRRGDGAGRGPFPDRACRRCRPPSDHSAERAEVFSRRRTGHSQPRLPEIRDRHRAFETHRAVPRGRRQAGQLRAGQPHAHPRQQPQHEADDGSDLRLRQRQPRSPASTPVRGEKRPAFGTFQRARNGHEGRLASGRKGARPGPLPRDRPDQHHRGHRSEPGRFRPGRGLAEAPGHRTENDRRDGG